MQNLVPPSHFGKDSRDGSPQIGMGKITPTTSSQKVGSGLTKPVLKTPDDFSPSSTVLVDPNQPVQRKVFPSTYLPPILPHRVVSQDSGFGWDQPKSNFGSNDNLQSLLNELKAENNQLHELIKQNLSEKDSKCKYNVITHQVQYIERLQQDIADSTCKLNEREAHISKLETVLHKKESQIQQQDLKLNQLSEELQKEKEKTSNLCETISSLKSNLHCSANEQEKLLAEHKSAMQQLRESHQTELEKLATSYENEQRCFKLQFEEEKLNLENRIEDNKKQLEIVHQSSLDENQQNYADKLLEIDMKRLKGEEQNALLRKEIEKLQNANDDLHENNRTRNEQLNNYKSAVDKCEEEIKRLTSLLQEHKESNTQLRTYIAQVQEDEHSRDRWKVEKTEMITAISALNESKEELEKTLEMLNVRFQSVSKILEMQEQAITAHTTAISDPQLQNKAAVVTSQWRAKVFELMVQCKSQEITSKEEESKHKLTVKSLTSKLEDETRDLEILANRLLDVEAQLELRNHINSTLESNNLKLKQEVQDFKQRYDQQDLMIKKLRDSAKEISRSYVQSYEDCMTTCMEKCLRMEQRLAFATNRVRTIQDLMKRKESMWRVRLQQALLGQSGETPIATNPTRDNPDLRMEVLHLTEERNSLSHQLAHDAVEFEKTIKSMKKTEEKYQEENRSLEKQITDHEEKIQHLNSILQDLEAKLDDEKYENDSLTTELKEAKLATKKDVEEALEVLKLHHCEEIREQESALNQVKKELTKAVVTLRQSERNSVREKNQLTEQLEAERQHWLNEEEKLRNNITHLQKNNNLLMTTLRQEGLLSAFKAARGSPVIEKTKDDTTAPKRVHFDQSFPKEAETMETTKTLEVDKMLQDLTNLSEMVLANSDNED